MAVSMVAFLETLRDLDAEFFIQTQKGVFPKELLQFSTKTPGDYTVNVVGGYNISNGDRFNRQKVYRADKGTKDISPEIMPQTINTSAGRYTVEYYHPCGSVLKIPIYSVLGAEKQIENNAEIARAIVSSISSTDKGNDNFLSPMDDVAAFDTGVFKNALFLQCDGDSTYLAKELVSGDFWSLFMVYSLVREQPLMPTLIADQDISKVFLPSKISLPSLGP